MSAINRMPRVVYDRPTGEHLVVLVLEPGEAEAIASALGPGDAGGRELQELADEARRLEQQARTVE